MFTGIISHFGVCIVKNKINLVVEARRDLISQLRRGSSIAINGVCLTVSDALSNKLFRVDIIPETLKKTSLGRLNKGDLVNLELPLRLNDRFNGHIVQGHVDGVGIIKRMQKEDNSRLLTITIPAKLNKYIVEKGSIAVNGISLTVIKATKNYFTVGIIPYTLKHTMSQQLKPGDLVNLEVDIITKYLEKLLLARETK